MRKIITLLGLVVVCLLFATISSCSKDGAATLPQQEREEYHTVKMRFLVEKPIIQDVDVRSVSSEGGWKDGDVVYLLFHKDNGTVTGKATYSAEDAEWTVSYYGAITRDKEMTVEAYYFDGQFTEDQKLNVTLSPTTGVYCDKSGVYFYPSGDELSVVASMSLTTGRIKFKGTPGTSITVGGVLTDSLYNGASAELSKTSVYVDVTVGQDGYTPYIYGVFEDADSRLMKVYNEGYLFITNSQMGVLSIGKSGWMNIPTETNHNGWTMNVSVKEISLSKSSLTIEEGTTETLIATILPADASDQEITWTSSDSNVATVSDNGTLTAKASGIATITVISKENIGVKATCEVRVYSVYNGYKYIDLGLPSGVMWAMYNVGATRETEFGDYYAWGEITTKSTYTSSNYTYTANPTTLPLDRDVAHVKWGGNWRMPTTNEHYELISKCTKTWTTIDDMNGCKVTGPNGNYIFLPAAGYFGSSLYKGGSYGDYWSSSIDISSYVWGVHFSSDYCNASTLWDRYYGRSVRPVFIR